MVTIEEQVDSLSLNIKKRIYKQHQKGKTIAMLSQQYDVDRDAIAEVIKIMKPSNRKNILKKEKEKKVANTSIKYEEATPQQVEEYIDSQDTSSINSIEIPEDVVDNSIKSKEDQIKEFLYTKSTKKNYQTPSNIQHFIIEDYKKLLSIKDISSIYGIDTSTIYCILKRNNIDRKSNSDDSIIGTYSSNKYKVLRYLENIMDLINGGIPLSRIAAKYDVPMSSFSRYYNKFVEQLQTTTIDELRNNAGYITYINNSNEDYNISIQDFSDIKCHRKVAKISHMDDNGNPVYSIENVKEGPEEDIDQQTIIEEDPAILGEESSNCCKYIAREDFDINLINGEYITIDNLKLRRYYRPECICAQMIADRHPFPCNRAIFDEVTNIFDIQKMENDARRFIANNITFVNGEAQQYLSVYVTGLSQAMTSIIKACLDLKVNLKMLFYRENNGVATYKPQFVITQFGKMSKDIKFLEGIYSAGDIYIDDTEEIDVNNFIRITIGRPDDSRLIICTSNTQTALEYKELIKEYDAAIYNVITTNLQGTYYYKL